MSETPESQEWRPQETDPLRRLTAEVRDLRRALRSLTNGILSNAGLKVEPDALRVTGNLDVSGDLDVTGPAAFGNDVSIDDDLTVGGSGVVTGSLRSANFSAGSAGWRLTSTGLEVNTITAKDAIIGNQALANPVVPQGFTETASGWSLSANTTSTRVTENLTVPSGFTQAIVTVNVYAQVIHGGGEDYFRVYPVIAGVQGRPGGTWLHAGVGDQANISMTRHVTGLSGGGTLTISGQVWKGTSASASADNVANITGVVLWFR